MASDLILPVPEVVLLVDPNHRIVRSSALHAGPRLGRLDFGQGRSLHEALHQGCSGDGCHLFDDWARAWKAHQAGLPVVWDWVSHASECVLRIRIQPVGYACGQLFGDVICDYEDCSVVVVEDATRERAHPANQPRAAAGVDDQLRTVTGQLLVFQEAERKRIAAELHDGLGQTLSLLRFEIEGCVERAEQSADGQQLAALQRTHDHVKRSLEELREIARNLSPAVINKLGLVGALDLLCSDFRTVPQQVHLDWQLDRAANLLPNELAVAIYRTAQEALHNIARHAGACEALLVFAAPDGGAELLVRDDGVGMPEDDANSHGLGLVTMRERVESLGGRFQIGRRRKSGCTLRASWSVNAILRLG